MGSLVKYHTIEGKRGQASFFRITVTRENGSNHLESNPFTLRRIAIHQDMTSTEAMLGCRILNIF